MVSLSIFLVCLLLTGVAATAWLWSRDSSREDGAPDVMETLASIMLVTSAAWVALNWALAPLHAIRAPFLLAASIALAAGSAVYLRAQLRAGGPAAELLRRVGKTSLGLTPVTATAIAAPLAVWIAFISWRGSITPILTYDGLSYHMPRAVDVVRTGTWRYLPVEDFRLAWFPSDYELMLADVLALSRTEWLTSLVGVVHYLGAFLLCVAWGERRWGGGPRAWIGAVAWGSTPLALLHSGAHKNDVMTMICTVSVALWGARWVVRGGVAPFVLALVAAALGVGTKPTGAFVLVAALVAFAPYGLFRQLRATLSTPRRVAAFAGGSVVLLLLLGIAPFAAHVAHPHNPADMGMTPEEMAATNITPTYSGWSNLWRFPVLLWLRPFSPYTKGLVVPWLDARWFWPKYEIYFSDFGVLLSCLAVLIPVAFVVALAGRKRDMAAGDGERARERAAASLFLLVTMVTILPIQYRIDGAFNSYARYVLFLPLLVVDWGVLPLIDRLPTVTARNLAVTTFVIVQSEVFFGEAFVTGFCDAFAAPMYLVHLMNHPNSRLPQAGYFPRAEQVLDTTAGPRDRVVIDGDFGAWIYPAYGRELTRDVEVAPLDSGARDRAVDTADWVVIDRYWAICWGAPQLTDMGKALAFFDRGLLSARDIVFYNRMVKDPRFTVFYRDIAHAQIVFHRQPR